MKLSVVIPVYNEEATVAAAVKSVLDVDYPCEMEVVLVDDGSTDGTWEKLAAINNPRLAKHTRAVNQGKGAAVRTAAKFATGDYIVPCDADLEYSPEEIPDLLRPIVRVTPRSSSEAVRSAVTLHIPTGM
jgi:dolichol-phosphate hexosyltransferase